MDFKRKNVFLSGAVTGMPNYNRDAFEKAEMHAYANGASYVYNPLSLAPIGNEDYMTHEQYMLRTIHKLTNLSRPFDLLMLLQGWEKSAGACIERDVAIACGIEILELQTCSS